MVVQGRTKRSGQLGFGPTTFHGILIPSTVHLSPAKQSMASCLKRGAVSLVTSPEKVFGMIEVRMCMLVVFDCERTREMINCITGKLWLPQLLVVETFLMLLTSHTSQ